MEKMYKPTVILNNADKRRLLELKLHYQGKNLDEKITVQKAIVMVIDDAYVKVFDKKTVSKKTKKEGSTPAKDVDLEKKINVLFIKSDTYMSSQDILQELGLPSSDGRKLAPAMNKLEIASKRTKTGKVYAVKRKN